MGHPAELLQSSQFLREENVYPDPKPSLLVPFLEYQPRALTVLENRDQYCGSIDIHV